MDKIRDRENNCLSKWKSLTPSFREKVFDSMLRISQLWCYPLETSLFALRLFTRYSETLDDFVEHSKSIFWVVTYSMACLLISSKYNENDTDFLSIEALIIGPITEDDIMRAEVEILSALNYCVAFDTELYVIHLLTLELGIEEKTDLLDFLCILAVRSSETVDFSAVRVATMVVGFYLERRMNNREFFLNEQMPQDILLMEKICLEMNSEKFQQYRKRVRDPSFYHVHRKGLETSVAA